MSQVDDEVREVIDRAVCPPELREIIWRHQMWLASDGQVGERADLSGKDFSADMLGSVDLSGVDLSGAKLVGTRLRRARLQWVVLNDADLTNADLTGSILKWASMRRVKASRCSLVDANVQFADLQEAELSYANMGRARLGDAKMENVVARSCSAEGASMDRLRGRGINLEGSALQRASFSNADLAKANLQYANLFGASLRGCSLQDANLFGTKLSDTDIRDVDFSGAKGLLNPIEFISQLEHVEDGVICYKAFGQWYDSPKHWKIQRGEIITEMCNPNVTSECGCGVNVATYKWAQDNALGELWRCLIRWEWLAGVTIPFNGEGKFRATTVQLLEKVR